MENEALTTAEPAVGQGNHVSTPPRRLSRRLRGSDVCGRGTNGRPWAAPGWGPSSVWGRIYTVPPAVVWHSYWQQTTPEGVMQPVYPPAPGAAVLRGGNWWLWLTEEYRGQLSSSGTSPCGYENCALSLTGDHCRSLNCHFCCKPSPTKYGLLSVDVVLSLS